MRAEFDAYAGRVRETAGFGLRCELWRAAAAGADDKFGHLRADLDALVQALAQRRAACAEAVGNSLNAQQLLLGLGLGATVLALLGSVWWGAASPGRCCG